MDVETLLASLDPTELMYEAMPLNSWDMGIASNADDVAKFMYEGGPIPPQNLLKGFPWIRLPQKDLRPPRKYWHFVKKEMQIFLCTDDARYKALWEQIDAFKDKSTTAIVGVISAFLGASIGVPASILGGFIAVCLHAVIKIGKEAYCAYIG